MPDTQTTGAQPPPPPPPPRGPQAAKAYWERVTEGASLEQLWKEFHSDARQSYNLYSREVNWEKIRAERKPFKRWLQSVWAVFQALLMKLSPARRVLLLAAMVLVLIPLPATLGGANDTSLARMLAIGATLLFALLALELADRVTMKRDLEIAREIQHWLVPEKPPAIPGAELASPRVPRTRWLATITMSCAIPPTMKSGGLS